MYTTRKTHVKLDRPCPSILIMVRMSRYLSNLSLTLKITLKFEFNAENYIYRRPGQSVPFLLKPPENI